MSIRITATREYAFPTLAVAATKRLGRGTFSSDLHRPVRSPPLPSVAAPAAGGRGDPLKEYAVPPCLVLVIDDNLYGLMVALSFI